MKFASVNFTVDDYGALRKLGALQQPYQDSLGVKEYHRMKMKGNKKKKNVNTRVTPSVKHEV